MALTPRSLAYQLYKTQQSVSRRVFIEGASRRKDEMARYLITGMAGFIGSTLARALLSQGHSVRGIDNLSTGRMENLTEILFDVEFEVADLQDDAAMRSACEGMDFVLHQAALASVPRSVKDPVSSHASNVNGTLSLLLAARDAGVKRIVYAASSSAYGDHGLETDSLRYFNIFGPRQAADSPYSGVIAQFIFKMLAGETPTINGDGLVSRDFNYVDNAVQANLLACTAPSEFANGRVFNVGTGKTHTLNDLFASLAEILQFPETAKYGPTRPGDIMHSQADISRAERELGYNPSVGFHAGLEKTAAWYVTEIKGQLVSV